MSYSMLVCCILATYCTILPVSYAFAPKIFSRTVTESCPTQNILPGVGSYPRYDRNDRYGLIKNRIGISQLYSSMKRTYAQRTPANRNFTSGLILDDFSQICESLGIYKKLYGDVALWNKFEVPAASPWPAHLHGLRLGRRLEKILTSAEFNDHPELTQSLKKHGFDPNRNRLCEDWDIIMLALKAYKEIHGDVRVNSRFEVPDEEPWPRLTRNLKLGARVAAIRSAGRYVKDNPERKVELDNIGFEWRVNAHTYRQQVDDNEFDQLLEMLKIYREHVDRSLVVPASYVIPAKEPWPAQFHGSQLGQIVENILKESKFVYGRADRADALAELGLDLTAVSSHSIVVRQRFDIIFEALKVYKEKNGDLWVPLRFVVPEGDPTWPEFTWNLKLGARVNAIRSQGTFTSNSPERRELLNSIGFCWELPSEAKRKKLTQSLADKAAKEAAQAAAENADARAQALAAARDAAFETALLEAVNADIDGKGGQLPTFGGSEDQPFGIGDTATTVVQTSPYASQRGGQNYAGAAVSDDETGPLIEQTTPVLASGSRGRGRPRNTGILEFIPAEEEKEKEEEKEEKKKNNQDEEETVMDWRQLVVQKPIPTGAGPRSRLPFNPSRMFEPSAYRETAAGAHIQYLLSRDYSSDPDIRQSAHFEGYLNSNDFNRAIAPQFEEDEIKFMKKTGYRMLEFGTFNWEMVIDALTQYKAIYGDVNVPPDFIISEDIMDLNLGFDVRHLNMELGEAVKQIRIGDVDALEDKPRRKQLAALGFDWGDKSKHLRFRFPAMYLGLKVYSHLYEHASPEEDFLVPDEPQWPYWMHGMPLGEWCQVACIQQQMFRQEYPERDEILRLLDFVWCIPPSADFPKKYYRAL